MILIMLLYHVRGVDDLGIFPEIDRRASLLVLPLEVELLRDSSRQKRRYKSGSSSPSRRGYRRSRRHSPSYSPHRHSQSDTSLSTNMFNELKSMMSQINTRLTKLESIPPTASVPSTQDASSSLDDHVD